MALQAPAARARAPRRGDKFGGRVGQEKERAQARQRGQRPDPRRLAERLREGARVDVGDPRAKTDNVKRVDLQTGEMVVNRNATRTHLPDLERWNREGRRSMGGFAVGAPREARR